MARQDVSDAVENNLILHSQSLSSAKSCECCAATAINQATVQDSRATDLMCKILKTLSMHKKHVLLQ